MTPNPAPESPELEDRLALLERLQAEARQAYHTSWWIFVLWGIAHLAAMLAQLLLGHPAIVWWSFMGFAGLAMCLLLPRMRRRQPVRTRLGQAIGSIWLAAYGASMVTMVGNIAGGPAPFFVLVGLANAASGLALRWPMQVAMACLWWASAIAIWQGGIAWFWPTMVVCAVVAEIGFGLYLLLVHEPRDREDALVVAR